MDQGAVIVGKVKTVQFASGMASADWVVDICPTNSRGDGRLDTDCSSSGSAAAIAGYEWLDFSIGSDSECAFILAGEIKTDGCRSRQYDWTCFCLWCVWDAA